MGVTFQRHQESSQKQTLTCAVQHRLQAYEGCYAAQRGMQGRVEWQLLLRRWRSILAAFSDPFLKAPPHKSSSFLQVGMRCSEQRALWKDRRSAETE